MKPSLRKWVCSLLGISVLVLLALYLKFNDPSESKAKYLPCATYTVTKLYCPGCGATRSAHALLNFDVKAAWKKNPLFVIAAPFIGFGFTAWFLRWFHPPFAHTYIVPRLNKLSPRLPFVVIFLIFLFGILRNIPFEPFLYLAPR